MQGFILNTMSDIITIYHNGSCSKCKGALEMLIEQNIPHNVRWYVAEPLSHNELEKLLQKLRVPAFDLVRTGEELYMREFAGKQLSEDQWIDILIAHPGLMQRPIVEKGGKAIIARPPERVLEMI